MKIRLPYVALGAAVIAVLLRVLQSNVGGPHYLMIDGVLSTLTTLVCAVSALAVVGWLAGDSGSRRFGSRRWLLALGAASLILVVLLRTTTVALPAHDAPSSTGVLGSMVGDVIVYGLSMAGDVIVLGLSMVGSFLVGLVIVDALAGRYRSADGEPAMRAGDAAGPAKPDSEVDSVSQ